MCRLLIQLLLRLDRSTSLFQMGGIRPRRLSRRPILHILPRRPNLIEPPPAPPPHRSLLIDQLFLQSEILAQYHAPEIDTNSEKLISEVEGKWNKWSNDHSRRLLEPDDTEEFYVRVYYQAILGNRNCLTLLEKESYPYAAKQLNPIASESQMAMSVNNRRCQDTLRVATALEPKGMANLFMPILLGPSHHHSMVVIIFWR